MKSNCSTSIPSIFIFVLLLLSCKKEYFKESEPTKNSISSTTNKRFFSQTTSLSNELKGVIETIRQQDSINHFVEAFSYRNGFPLWDKTFSNEELATTSTINKTADISINSEENSDTLFFIIPLKRDDVKDINTFLAVTKVADQYKIKVHQRSKYTNSWPKTTRQKDFGRSIMAIFGIFEKKINSVDSINIAGAYNETIKDGKFKFKRGDGTIIVFDQPSEKDSYTIRSVEYCAVYKPCNYCAYAGPAIQGNSSTVADVAGQNCWTEYYISYTNDNYTAGGGSGGGNGSGGTGGGGSTGGSTTVTLNCTSADWWCETGEYRVVNGAFYTPDYYPYKNEGWEWLWWEKPYTSSESQILTQLSQEDNQANTALNLDCKGTQRTGNFSWNGTREHWLIMLDFISKNRINGEIEYAIPGSSVNSNRGYADMVDRFTGEIFEIKPPSLLSQGIAEVDNYVLKANQYCLSSLTGTSSSWKKGVNYQGSILPVPWNPLQVLESSKGANGVIVYNYKDRLTNPLPIAIPQASLEKIRNLINKLKDKVTDYDKIILRFLQDPANRDILLYLKTAAYGAATAIVVGTIIEDILTAGLGVADDWASFVLAYRIVRIASKL